MKTKSIALYYRITQKEILAPAPDALNRKNEWIEEIQKTLHPKETRVVKLVYTLYNPEIRQMQRFFNGPVVEYYAIQNKEMTEGRPGSGTIDKYREQMLDELLGYDLELINRTVRRRQSTGDWIDTQKWHDFLEEVQQDLFDAQGYIFPDSKHFWEVVEKSDYEKAQETVIKELQEKLKHKLSTPPNTASATQ